MNVPPTPEVRGVGGATIRGESLGKTYPDGTVALVGVSILARPGRCLGVVGENGAGKTTLLRILTGLIATHEGTLTVSSHSRRLMGSLIEQPAFYPFLTTKQNLSLVSDQVGSSPPAVDMAIERTGLGPYMNKPAARLSAGLRQRLGLALALLDDPSIIVLDEPMTALDPLSQRNVKEVIQAEKSRGGTVILSSHGLSDLEQLADDLVVLRRGRCVYTGTVAELSGEAIFEITVRDVRRAETALSAAGCSVTIRDDKIFVPAEGISGGLITTTLVDASVPPDQIVLRGRSLEMAYLEFMKDDASVMEHGDR